MADIQFDITLDLVEKYVPAENVTVVQEDYQSVKFVYTILNREQPVDLSGATDIVVSFVKPDGHIILQNDGTLVGNTIELVANPQAFTYVGKTYLQVQYKIGTSIYNTRQAFLWVERGNTSCQTLSSTDFAPMLDQAIQAGQMLSGIDLQALIDSKVTAENAQADVDALELRVGALEVTIVGLDSRVDALEASQAVQDTAISGLQTSQATQDTKIATLETVQADLSSRVTSVEGNITTVVSEVDALQLTSVDHEARIDGLEASMPNLDPINTAITALQAKDVEQDGRIGTNETAISGLQTKNNQQDASIANNATEIGNLQAEQTTQNNRLTAVENKNAAQDSAIGDIQSKNTAQDAAISALQSSQATQDTDIAAIKVKNTQQDTAISVNATSIVSVDTKVDTNKTAQDTINSGVAGSLSNHSTRIEALEADATVDDARITNLEGDNTSNKNRISNVEGAIGVLNSDINDLQGNDAVQDSRLNAIESKNTTQDGQIAANSAAITANKTDADSKITGLTTRLGTAEGDIAGLKTKDTQQDTRMSAIENKNAEQDANLEATQEFANSALVKSTENASQILDLQYIEKNNRNLSRAYHLLKRNTSMSVVCVGDSLTYGADSFSVDKRPAKSDPTLPPDCTATNTQASTTYPEKIQQLMDSCWGGGSTSKVTIINRGIPGDKASDGIGRYPSNPNSNLAIIGYGANDIGNTNANDFFKALCDIAKRYIEYGNGIVFLSIPRRASTTSTLEIISFNAVIKQVADYFRSPFIDLGEALTGYESNLVYADTDKTLPLDDRVHFNGLGYSIIATKVFAKLIDICSPNSLKIRNNNYISSYSYASPSFYNGGVKIDLEGTAGGDLPSSSNNSFYMQVGVGQSITYSFYTEESDMLLLPHFHNNNAETKCEITIDSGVQQAKPQIPTMLRNTTYIRQNSTSLVIPKSIYSYPDGYSSRLSLGEHVEADIDNKIIQLSQRGFHTVTVKNIGSSGVLYFFGFMCFDYYNGLQIINAS